MWKDPGLIYTVVSLLCLKSFFFYMEDRFKILPEANLGREIPDFTAFNRVLNLGLSIGIAVEFGLWPAGVVAWVLLGQFGRVTRLPFELPVLILGLALSAKEEKAQSFLGWADTVKNRLAVSAFGVFGLIFAFRAFLERDIKVWPFG